ncbi:MAG: DNA translocase FtsK [SAR202 cluster bacterium]|nr:DNA translocase FtsK [SAR202 cluster bacterium]
MLGSSAVAGVAQGLDGLRMRFPWLTRPRMLAIAAGVLLFLALIGYWQRDAIAGAFMAAKNGLVGTLGLGLLPITGWLAAFGFVAWKRRDLFAYYRAWLASVGALAFLLGLMGFFYPTDGFLGAFSLGGEVSLGGKAGEAIVGHNVWLGPFRLLGVLLVTIWTAFPYQATDIALRASIATGKGAMAAYAFVVVAATAAAARVGLGRGPKPEPRTLSVDNQDEENSGLDDPDSATLERWSHEVQTRQGVTTAQVKADEATSLTEAKSTLATAQHAPKAAAAQPPVKFNKYWTPSGATPQQAIMPAAPGIAVAKEGASEQSSPESRELQALMAKKTLDGPKATGVPLTDNMAHKWQRPPRDILQDAEASGISEKEMENTAETIRTTLSDYGVEVEIGQIRPGPAVTMYGLNPGWVRKYKQGMAQDKEGRPILDKFGKPIKERVETKMRVRVDSILAREKDLSLALKTPSIRIETPVMGKSLVGIEVPNPRPDLVTLRGMMDSDDFRKLRQKAPLSIALGKGSGGENVVADLSKMPHLLVAGATGSGKSVCLNTIVCTLTMERSPAEVRLLLIDPKRVELTQYNGIPHLLTPVVVESDEVVGLLKGMIREMLNRYKAFETGGVRNIDSYNKKMTAKMPYLVIIVDELADLMMTAAFDVEHSLCRLAQLGRATGIHLVVATQRPSVDVVTGLIKANFPSRISFGVTSQIDSRTILDSVGAEKLLGRGDMLYMPLDASRPNRLQGAYVSDTEIQDLVAFWKNLQWPPLPKLDLSLPIEEEMSEDGEGNDEDLSDDMLDKAIEMARQQKKISTSLLQRRLRIGYPRAARLMDELEDKGIVGPSDGSKSRDVILSG